MAQIQSKYIGQCHLHKFHEFCLVFTSVDGVPPPVVSIIYLTGKDSSLIFPSIKMFPHFAVCNACLLFKQFSLCINNEEGLNLLQVVSPGMESYMRYQSWYRYKIPLACLDLRLRLEQTHN